MNERIEELAKQCYVKTGSPHTDHFEYWKFAESIIRECVATLKEDMELAHIQLIPLDFKMYASGRLQRTIKDHFGVEL